VPKIAKERTQQNQQRVESAALELFTTQGFHGTNNREIAAKLGVSTGTIYTYFSSKEAIFASLTRKHRSHLAEWMKEAAGDLNNLNAPRIFPAWGFSFWVAVSEWTRAKMFAKCLR
jgi:AcrR family transcriptional regulator